MRISAETLYVQAGFLEDRPVADVASVILSDVAITERQKQSLVQIYEAFREETARHTAAAELERTATLKVRPAGPDPKKATAKKAPAKASSPKNAASHPARSPSKAAPGSPSAQRARARTTKEA